MYKLEWINQTDVKQFSELLGEVFEKSSWIAMQAAKARPFESKDVLYEHMVTIVKQADYSQQLQLINKHPSLGERVQMSDYSTKEQQQAGLNALTEEEYRNFLNVNEAYMKKFSFPFIIAVRGKSKDEIYQSMIKRLEHDPEVEFQTALTQIYAIAKFRLDELIL